MLDLFEWFSVYGGWTSASLRKVKNAPSRFSPKSPMSETDLQNLEMACTEAG